MLNQTFKPSLSDLITLDSLPDSFGFLKTPLNTITSKLFYQNLQVNRSKHGDSAIYNLDIIFPGPITLLEIPGADLEVILNPNDPTTGNPLSSLFNVSFRYEWEVLKYIQYAKIETFGFDIRSYINLLSSSFSITVENYIEGYIEEFIGDATQTVNQQAFVDQYNSSYSPSITSFIDVNDIIGQITSSHDVLEVLIDEFLKKSFDDFSRLIAQWTGALDEKRLKDIVIPRFSGAINDINLGITLPRSVFIPLDSSGNQIPAPAQSMLTMNAGSILFDSVEGMDFKTNFSFDFTHSEIMNTGFTIALDDVKVDLSEKKNIPEANLDGRPADFMGVYIKEGTLTFPAFWNQDPNSSGVIKTKNMLAGTGGLSGVFTLAAANGIDPDPIVELKLGEDFIIELNQFELTLSQGTFVDSKISGGLHIPGFKDMQGNDAYIEVDIEIKEDGDFSITAKERDGINIQIASVLDFTIYSLTFGKADNGFYADFTGTIKFQTQGGPLGNFLPEAIELENFRVYDDGRMELVGGTIDLKKPLTLELKPVKISITAIHFGSYEQMYGGSLRKYFYFGFDGGVSVNPGGVDARGDGIKFYFTADGQSPFHSFMRIQGISVDLMIPGDATPETATLIVSGYLAMKDPAPGNTNPGGRTEYVGGIDFSLPKVGVGGSAAMRYSPDIPAFLIDVGLELPAPIVLGSTGLGLYGFRGLFGHKYVASREEAGVAPDGRWWEYYKAKVSPDYREGVQASKFKGQDGFSVGVGASLATAPDSGKTFSSKVFLLLSLPEVFLIQGQGQFFKERIGLDSTYDPPFFAMIAFSDESIEAAFGVDYFIPDTNNSKRGLIANINALIELAYFFEDSSAWYINIGRDEPEDMRVTARIFDWFDAYFFLMINSSGISAGAGASFELNEKFGPLRAELRAYLDTRGQLSYHPVQIGGSIVMGGSIKLSAFGFTLGVSAEASLTATAPKPYTITGKVEGCITVARKEYCADFDFTLNIDADPVTTPLPLMDNSDLSNSAKAFNMESNETFELFTHASGSTNPPNPATWGDLSQYLVPLDCYIDFELKKPVKPQDDFSSLDKIGGQVQSVEYTQWVPPQRTKPDRVQHRFICQAVRILCWNPSSNSWEQYDPYAAGVQMQDLPFVDTSVFPDLKHGWWQTDQPNKINKVRVLARSPISFLNQATGGVIPEEMEITKESIFCEGTFIESDCITFDGYHIGETFNQGSFINNSGRVFDLYDINAKIVNVNGVLGYSRGLEFLDMGAFEIQFEKPTQQVSMRWWKQNTTMSFTSEFIQRVDSGNTDSSGMPIHTDQVVQSTNHGPNTEWVSYSGSDAIDRVRITFTQPGGPISIAVLLRVCGLDIDTVLKMETHVWQNDIQGQNTAMIDAYNKTIQPIWRPNTIYAVQVIVSDKVYRESSHDNTKQTSYTLGFKTVGGLGHFHRYTDPLIGSGTIQRYNDLLALDREDEFRLANLEPYVNYERSYPNAKGNLLGAKPLYREDPTIRMFFTKDYIYLMFSSWDAYEQNVAVDVKLEVKIKDPNDPNALLPSGEITQAASWHPDPQVSFETDEEILNNFISNGPCSTVTSIDRQSSYAVFDLPDLKPLKLYTAIFNSVYKPNGSNPTTSEVHRYVFKSSRYMNLDDHVNSYKLKDESGTVVANAIYEVEQEFDSADLTVAGTIIDGTMANNDPLRVEFGNEFDRLVSGVLKVNSLPGVENTEFNVIKDATSGDTLGILIRSTEPFNDPLVPPTTMDGSLTLSVNSGATADNKVFFSKDHSQAFITKQNGSLDMATGSYDFTFKYFEFNGSTYTQMGTAVNTSITVS